MKELQDRMDATCHTMLPRQRRTTTPAMPPLSRVPNPFLGDHCQMCQAEKPPHNEDDEDEDNDEEYIDVGDMETGESIVNTSSM